MSVFRSRWHCGGLAMAIVICLVVVLPGTAVAAPPRFFANMKSGTWTAHLTGEDGAQGEAWLRKTPCGLGSFVQLKAPTLAGLATEERLVYRGDGDDEAVLAVVPSSLPDFGIVIAYWPTGTSAFPDEPGDLFVQFAANVPYGDALPYPYTSTESAWMTPEEYFEALDSGDVWVEVLVDDEIVMSGRVYR